MSRCVGCGIKLQNVDANIDGYVESLDYNLCHRCFVIKNYGKDTIVDKKNTDYLKKLDDIKKTDVVVYISSLLTLNLDYIKRFDNVILVLTKRDILPKSIKDGKIINYVKERYNNISSVFVVSAYKKYNLDKLYNELRKYSDRNIYFVGLTNSGKSTLINELIKSYNGLDGEITMSNYPSTTLDIVSVNIGSLHVKDTPGIMIDNSIIHFLNEKEIKKVNSKKEIKPITFQIRGSGAILIDDYFRLEYNTNNASITFYMSNNLDISSISIKNDRLANLEYKEFKNVLNQDIVIEDLGFMKVTNSTDIKVFNKYDNYMYIRNKLI